MLAVLPRVLLRVVVLKDKFKKKHSQRVVVRVRGIRPRKGDGFLHWSYTRRVPAPAPPAIATRCDLRPPSAVTLRCAHSLSLIHI